MNSPVVTSAQMRDAENAAFARGVSAEALMNQAGAGIAQAVQQFFPRPGYCLVFSGKGNNGGDALVAAARLKRAGWQTDVHLSFPESQCSDLLRKKITEFRDTPAVVVAVAANAGGTPASTIILDGLLGLGSKPPLRDPILAGCREINRLRQEHRAYVFAVDQPTGLNGDSGEADRDCVISDFTTTIAATKRGLIADDATNFIGRLEVVPLSDLPLEAADETVACTVSLRGLVPRRPFNAHKNQFGRVGIVAGSRGFAGAATMCAWGALRGGAGLVEVFVPENIYEIVAAASPFEAMVKPVKSYRNLIEEKIDVWGIGPGLGRDNASEIIQFVQRAQSPMVVDADALNIISADLSILKNCRGPRLLTPHPGEMKRLAGDQKNSRAELARKFTSEFPVTLLLKGSRTVVAESGKRVSYNTTGNPGMATGGMGDVLTGVCAALLAQKLSPFDAARVGAWVCGRAAELALFDNGESEQSLLPRDVVTNLGRAFREL
ncbi:MAG: bifunctional ADP-dependent NAD(P)H-hydrate dehydratase/NAD(P)H-hydrate epimerase [Verrucomicrobia bacterium]|nr:MAG: bifunctional ADP-dependent NAD(P)H-hydrate dehydratase/NAD(P)H-hydrate epimerase [Verrucomicrobiota bacterium]